MSNLLKSTLLRRCCEAYADSHGRNVSPVGMHAALFQLASELNAAGHRDAARFLLEQLSPKVVQLRPPGDGGAA